MMKDTAVLPSFDTLAVKQAAVDVIRTHSKTFYFATNLLPAAQREAVRALLCFSAGQRMISFEPAKTPPIRSRRLARASKPAVFTPDRPSIEGLDCGQGAVFHRSPV